MFWYSKTTYTDGTKDIIDDIAAIFLEERKEIERLWKQTPENAYEIRDQQEKLSVIYDAYRKLLGKEIAEKAWNQASSKLKQQRPLRAEDV